jgi:hypothetical protein
MLAIARLKASSAASVFCTIFENLSSSPRSSLSKLSESLLTDSLASASDCMAPPSFGSSVANTSKGSRETAPWSTSSLPTLCRGGLIVPGTSWISASPRSVVAMRGSSSL